MAHLPHVLDDPETRDWFLEALTRGEHTAIEASKKIGTYWKSVKRYADEHEEFGEGLKRARSAARKQAARARRRAKKRKRKAEEARLRKSASSFIDPHHPQEGGERPAPGGPNEPRKLPDGSELPPLSVQAFLEEQWFIIHNRKAENASIVRMAQRVLGSMVVRPVSDPLGGYVPPPVDVGGPGDSRPKVVLMAPDNGTYAPGCGPVPEDEEGVA